MDLLNDHTGTLFRKFLIPAVSSAIAVAAYSFVDTIAIGHGVGPEGTAACAIILYHQPFYCSAVSAAAC